MLELVLFSWDGNYQIFNLYTAPPSGQCEVMQNKKEEISKLLVQRLLVTS